MARKVKVKPVIMPAKPPYEVLWEMAGKPVILAASEEQYALSVYAMIRKALRKAAK